MRTVLSELAMSVSYLKGKKQPTSSKLMLALRNQVMLWGN